MGVRIPRRLAAHELPLSGRAVVTMLRSVVRGRASCAACGLSCDAGRRDEVVFCRECLDRAHPTEYDELGVVD